ncbi:LOW QUALITY PROTEIN: C6orf136 isoform 2 [Pan troglodytes]|uniref:C6orf136 isoform 2 n=3 Tax=Pan troglodytes TaxID=9598 RepID=A0A6D2X244_PANTR|nr:LOW QUALITY PROTEIN: C6orf136 isoform 2 [Pan troglodytes]
MYQPSRGAARRLGPCLRAYQARPQVSGGEAGGRRGGGERPSSKPVRGAERALGSAQAQRHPPPLPTCALQRVDRLGVAGAGGRRCRACRARTSVLPGLRAVRRGQGQAAGRVCVAPDSPRLPVPRGDLKGRGREIRSPAAAPSRSSPAQTRPAGRPQQPARLALGERSWQEGRPVCTWFGPLRPGWQDGHAPSRDGASRTPSGTEDQLYPGTLPFPPLWPHSTTTTSPSSPLFWSPLPPRLPTQRLPQVPPLPLPQIQALSSAWVVLPPGKGEEGPGPELHSGCLDGLRSLFEGPPCPYPGAWIPFQVPGTAHPSPATPSGDPSMEEHLSVMYERLRQELPKLFLQSHDYSLYSLDVEFINEILNIRTKGRTWYILSLTLCRFLAWNYFAHLRLEVLQLTRHPENWTLQARWRLVGLPVHLLFLRFYKRDKDEHYRTYDAYSTFYLNSSGLICRHRLDKLMPSHSPPTPVKKLLVGALVALGLSEPEPDLNLCSKP